MANTVEKIRTPNTPLETRRKILKTVPATALSYFAFPLASVAQTLDLPKSRVRKPAPPDKAAVSLIPHRRIPLEYSENQRLLGVINSALPSNKQEEAVVRTLADEIGHAIVQVSTNPNDKFAKGSFAAKFQEKYRTLNTIERASVRARAESLLSQSLPERRMYFGQLADKGVDAHKRAYAGFNATLNRQLKTAIHATTNLYRQDIEDYVTLGARISSSANLRAKVSKTKILDIGNFIRTDSQFSYGLKTTVNSANETRDFKWETEESSAKIGVWKVFEMPANTLVATGAAGNAPQDVFRIDFKRFAPPTPPAEPLVYHVKVYPFPQPAKAKLGQRTIKQEPVGPASPPAIVVYSKSDDQQTKFDQIYDVYREIKLFVDWLEMTQDSCEWGTEEFHISGFVQDYPMGEERDILHQSVDIDPAGERRKQLGSHEMNPEYHLQNPTSEAVCRYYAGGSKFSCWPKVFTACIAVMEEDNDSYAEWVKAIWNMARGQLESKIRDTVLIEMESKEGEFGEFLAANVLGNLELFRDLINMLVGSITSALLGMLMSILDTYIGMILEGMENDFYELATFVLVLPNNIADYVETLPGSATPNGRYALRQEPSEPLRGPPCPGGATSWDGVVTVGIHWEFRGKEQI